MKTDLLTAKETLAKGTPQHEADAVVRATWAGRYRAVRALTEELCAPLQTEDYVIQSMPDASPAKWQSRATMKTPTGSGTTAAVSILIAASFTAGRCRPDRAAGRQAAG